MPATLELHSTGSGNNLGGAHDSAVLGNSVNALWDNVSSAEAATGDTEYRAVDLTNVGGADSVETKFFLSSLTARGDDGNYAPYSGNAIRVGIESNPIGSTTALSDESTKPSGVTFSSYTSLDAALSLPAIPAGGYARVFLERKVVAGSSNQNSIRSTMDWDYA